MEELAAFLENIPPFMEGLTPLEMQIIWALLAVALLSIGYAYLSQRHIRRKDAGTDRVQEVAGFIKAGTHAYLRQQAQTISILTVILALAMAASVWFIPPTNEMVERFGSQNALLWVAGGRAGALLLGVLFAYVAASTSMKVAVEGTTRVIAAASKGYNQALRAAYQSSTITGLLTVGLGLLGVTTLFFLFGIATPDVLPGFVLGISLVALFTRIGGGIHAQAARLGADVAARQEEGLTREDPRNAAGMSRFVGMNASDSAGTPTDLFESFGLIFIAALSTGLLLGDIAQGESGDGLYAMRFLIFPLTLTGIGLLASIIGNLLVRTDDKRRNARAALNTGLYIAAAFAIAGFAGLSLYYMLDPSTGIIDWRPFFATTTGVVLTIVLHRFTGYYTSTLYNPVKAISRAAKSGTGTGIISGIGLGFSSSAWFMLLIALALGSSAVIYITEPAETRLIAMLYSLSLTGIGVFALAGSLVSIGSLAPVTGSAGSISQLSEIEKNPRNVVEDLQVIGETTQITLKGTAIGLAIIATFALAGTFVIGTAQTTTTDVAELSPSLNLAKPAVLLGLLLGGMLPLLCSSFVLRAAMRAAVPVVREVRRQFNVPEIMQRSEPPDYAQAARVSAAAIRFELVYLGAVVILAPVLVGFLLGLEALGSFLIGVILSGQLTAVAQLHASSAWDSARRYVEEGFYGGKNSETHQATLVGSTIGTPLGETTGSALNPIIKLVGLVALIIAPLVALFRPALQSFDTTLLVTLAVCALVWLWAIRQSSREAELEPKKAKSTGKKRKVKTKTRSKE